MTTRVNLDEHKTQQVLLFSEKSHRLHVAHYIRRDSSTRAEMHAARLSIGKSKIDAVERDSAASKDREARGTENSSARMGFIISRMPSRA